MFSSALSILLGLSAATAITIPLERRAPPHGTTVRISGAINTTGDDPLGFQSANGDTYTGTILVAGQAFSVELDTGSADLWVDTTNASLSGLTDTQVDGTVRYVDGSTAHGNINLGNVTWGDYTVPKQAFINAPNSNATKKGRVQGLLGIGPPTLSNIHDRLNTTQYDGTSFLDNIFSLYPNEPNYITFLLTRREDIRVVDGGIFTIGELAPNLGAIAYQPQLAVATDNEWATFMDGMTVNGKFISGGSLATSQVKPPGDKTFVIFDTGSTLVTAPASYVDAIYSGVPGAILENGRYYVPCDTKLNVSLTFGSQSFPIHPFDLTWPMLLSKDRTTVGCLGTFVYASDSSGVDFVLGARFLRNAYTLLDFGHWATVGNTQPYIKMLSVTDPEQAWADFDSMNEERVKHFVESYPQSSANPTYPASSQVSAYPVSSSTPSVVVATPVSSSVVAPSPVASSSVAGSSPAAASPSPVPSAAASASASASASSAGVGTAQDKDLQVHAAAASADDTSSVDWDALTRNIYIIIGLLGAVIVLLLALVIKSCWGSGARSGGKGYRALKEPFPPQHDKPYTSEAYSTPYADGGH